MGMRKGWKRMRRRRRERRNKIMMGHNSYECKKFQISGSVKRYFLCKLA